MKVVQVLCAVWSLASGLLVPPVRRTTTTSGRRKAVEDGDEFPSDAEAIEVDSATVDELVDRGALKSQVLAVCASCDRGFGASSEDRAEIEDLLKELSACSPVMAATEDWESPSCPLRKCWRLVYTSASDVSILGANPLFTLGGIYQDARDLPTVVNVIDARPKVLSLAPPQFGDAVDTLSRQLVYTTGSVRGPNRVGLVFDRVEIQPKSLLGQQIPELPFSLGLDLPTLPKLPSAAQRQLFDLANSILPSAAPLFDDDDSGDNSPAYFDVTYLDSDFLVIKQAAPGGLFAAVAVDDFSPP